MQEKINPDYPYRHIPQDVLVGLRNQLQVVNETVTDLFASDLEAIPHDLDGVNSAYIEVEIELAWREVESGNVPQYMGENKC